MRNALKALGAVLAVAALCAPLMLLPPENGQPVLGYAGVTLTVPPTVIVATTIPGLETTTTTTEAATPPVTEATSSTTTTTGPIDVTIAAAGDVFPPAEVLESIRDEVTGSHDFGPVLAPVAPYLFKADYSVAMLGSLLAGPEAGYTSDSVANAPRELAFALKKAGVDLVGTAGAHSLDLGWQGLVGTLDRLDAAGLAHVGTARTKKERDTPVIANIKGVRVAFLDYTSVVAKTLPPEDKKGYAVSTLDLEAVKQDAALARNWGADAVVAMVNFGPGDQGLPQDNAPTTEASTTTTSTTTSTTTPPAPLSEQILDRGVDAILGCQTGRIGPIGHIFPYASWRANDKYIAYSLGDFFSTDEDKPGGGLIAYLHLQKRGLRTYVTGVSYLPLYVQTVGPQDSSPASTTSSTLSGAATSTSQTNGPLSGAATSTSQTSGSPSDPATSPSTTVPSTTSTTSASERGQRVAYRILPVLPGLSPETDIPLSPLDRQLMATVWEDARGLLYRPDENISPLIPADLGL